MAGFNPCYCWNLKDGCITVGIWTLLFSLCQLSLFGWQTDIIKWLKDKAGNDRAGPNFGVWKPEHERWPGYYEEYWMTGKEKHYLGLFVIQILNLIAAFFLLFASVALIYGIHTSSKYLVWPWFPCITAGIICSLAYCVMWWAGDVTSYWLVLTVVEVISVFINLYCLFCVVVQYRRIVRGYIQASEDDSVKNQQLIGYEYPYRPGDTGVVTYAAPEKKVGADGGVLNYMYEPEGVPGRVHMYGKDPYGHPPGHLVTYATEPLTGQAQDGADDPYPCSKSEMTAEWLNNVTKSQPEEPPKIPILDHPPSPGRERYQRSKSLDALEKEGREKKKGMKASKSKDSVSSRHGHGHGRRGRRDSSCSTCSSSETETVDSRKGRSRSEGRHRDRRGSDSEDTGYSRSAADSDKKHRKHRHHHHKSHHGHGRHSHKNKEKSEDDRRSRKRLRDVKREDKERRQQQQQQETQQLDRPPVPALRPESTGGPRIPVGAVPVFPFGAGGQTGAISIPQHIVIPPQPKGAPHQPQRFHINSEITISYSDRSAPGSDSEHRPGSGGRGPGTGGPVGGPVIMPASISTPSPGPRQQTPPVPPPRIGNNSANTSGDSSKGYGSTAV